MGILLTLLLLLSPCTSHSAEISDPFVNPLHRLIILDREKGHETIAPSSVNLFTPRLKKSLNELRLEGIIGKRGDYYLVVSDPDTGRTYLLKEGEPVSPDTKIGKILFNRVILVKYYKEKGKLKRERITLKVDTEG